MRIKPLTTYLPKEKEKPRKPDVMHVSPGTSLDEFL